MDINVSGTGKKYYKPKNNKYEDNLNKLHSEMKGGK